MSASRSTGSSMPSFSVFLNRCSSIAISFGYLMNPSARASYARYV